MSYVVRLFCFLFAACSMLYYLLLTRLVAELTGDVMLWSAIGSGVFLCANGVGVFWSERAVKGGAFRMIARLEALSAWWGPVAVSLLYVWHMVYRMYMYEFGYPVEGGNVHAVLYFGAVAQVFIAGVGVLSGWEFGLMNQLGFRSGLSQVQRLMAVYQFGGLLGTVLLLGLLLPRFEPLAIVFAVSAINLVTVFAWRKSLPEAKGETSRSYYAVGASLALLGGAVYIYDLPQLQRKNFYYNDLGWMMDNEGIVNHYQPYGLLTWIRRAGLYPTIDRRVGAYQAVDLLADIPARMPVPEADQPLGWTLFLDGHFQASSLYEVDYHQALAHVPTTLLGHAGKRILVVGGGDGLLVRELLRYKNEVESIKLIDIDPLILDLAAREPKLLHLNQASLLDPKVQVMATDAFQALRHSRESFDKIYVDVLFPFNFETSRLYSLEFFATLKRHLAPGGHLAMLSPVAVDEKDDPDDAAILALLSSTLRVAGFRDLYLFGEKRHSFILALPEVLPPARLAARKNSQYNRLIMNQDHMDEVERLPGEGHLDLVNSILKPRFFGQRDTNF